MTEPALRPAPALSADSEPFWSAAREHRLTAQECGSCHRLRHPPRPICPHCHSTNWSLRELSGRGTVYSYAIVEYPPLLDLAMPALSALVDLAEGVRLLTALVGIDADDIRIGLPVELRWESARDGFEVPVFTPVTEEGQ
jgi:uncharacterized protein